MEPSSLDLETKTEDKSPTRQINKTRNRIEGKKPNEHFKKSVFLFSGIRSMGRGALLLKKKMYFLLQKEFQLISHQVFKQRSYFHDFHIQYNLQLFKRKGKIYIHTTSGDRI